MKTIAVLTSGGDAPGMNAAVRAVVRAGISKGFRVVGVRRGYKGLLERDISVLDLRSVSNILPNGGTALYTSRCPEFLDKRYVKKAADICREEGIDVVVTIGGDGTFKGALSLSEEGIPCIGIPGTIDNDIASSEYTIGFDTAVNTVVQMVDRVRDTSRSHDRCSVIEVMGRSSGYIALEAGIACGALCVLVPEIPYDLENDVIPRMMETLNTGKQHFIIMVAEGAGSAVDIAKRINEKTNITTSPVVLGYVQRGGSPSSVDRVVASAMGCHAVSLIEQGARDRVVVWRDGKITDFDITEALKMKKTIDSKLLEVVELVSI